MKLKEYRAHLQDLKTEDLYAALGTVEQELFNLKLNVRAGQVKNVAHIKKLKRNIARVKTMLHARMLNQV